jgi:two-component system sensor histidine kinase BarA
VVKEWGIKSRVLFLTLVPTITISLLLSAYFTSTRIQDLEKALKDRGYAIALQLAPASEYGVFSGNTYTLHRLANDALSEPEVRSVSIFNKDGRLLAHAGHEHQTPTNILSVSDQLHGITMADTGNSLLFTVPVLIRDVITEDFAYADSPYDHAESHDNVLGWINIELGRMTTTIRQYQVLFACSIIVLIGLGISGIFAYRMGRDVTQPILQMANAVEKLKNGNLDTRVQTQARGELGKLESGINTMAQSLKEAHEEMQQSVEQATADLRQTLETIEIQNIELELARKEAETASKVKSDFLANMSHEIRTPLNGVIGFINLLMKTKLEPRQEDYLQTINKSAQNLLSIINDILDFSKIEADKLTLDKMPMDINECIEEALTLMAPSAHEKRLALVPMIYADVPEKIIADPLRLKQIITNLVSNAVKFTDKGEVVVRVMLEKETHNQVILRISISDTGIGLSNHAKKTLFKAFSQADSTTTRRFGGTGLGLVISKRLVQQMGGEIRVESKPGQGATFSFTFFADKTQKNYITKINPKLKNNKVLLFEEHNLTRLSLKHVMSTWELKISEVHNLIAIKDLLLAAYHQRNPYKMLMLGLDSTPMHRTMLLELIETCKKYNCHICILSNTTELSIYEDLENPSDITSLAKPVTRKKLLNALITKLLPKDELEQALHDYDPKSGSYNKTDNISKFNILAVDDNPSNLKLVAALLENMGLNVDCANGGEEALAISSKKPYDLIFMDIQMPDMDGIQVTQKIRKREDTRKHTPIIALTAHALDSEREALLCAGMDDYLTKPIDERELQRIVNHWIETYALATEETTLADSFIEEVTEQPINWERSIQLAGNNPQLAHEMLNGLIENIPQAKKLIQKAYNNKNYAQLREEVHKLHGACCYCGVGPLKMVVEKLESAAAKSSATECDIHIKEFKTQVKNVLSNYEEIIYDLAPVD